MSCDIHLCTEVKIGGVWHTYGTPNIRRDYRLFAKMAGVRNHAQVEEPIDRPRGMPEDAAVVTRTLCDADGEDGHSHSYLTAEEIVHLERWWEVRYCNSPPPMRWPETQWGFLFGNSWGGFLEEEDVRERLLALGVEDVRFIFWFDS